MNELDQLIIDAETGRIPVKELLTVLVKSNLVIPSMTEVQDDGSGFSPCFFERNGHWMMAVYTDLEHAKKLSDRARYCVMAAGGEVLRTVREGCGIVLNPRCEVGLEFPPQGVSDIIRDFCGGREKIVDTND